MTEFSQFIVSLLTAAGLSGLVGLEREMRIQDDDGMDPYEKRLGGLRTFAMMGILGFVSAYLAIEMDLDWMIGLVMVMAFGISLVTHVMAVYFHRSFGITTEFALLGVFLIGVMVGVDEVLLAVSVSILFTGLLALKNVLHKAVKKINKKDLIAILQFFILSAVILPILPSSWIDPFGFFDWRPQTVWLMVVLVASIRFIGYFLAKFIKTERSILLSGVIGGFISSTAVTVSLSQESKGKSHVMIYFIPILIASALMFFRVLLEVTLVTGSQPDLIFALLPVLLVLGLLFFIAGVFFLYWTETKKAKTKPVQQNIEMRQPLNLGSALIFGAFFLFVLLISEKIAGYFADSGLYITGAIAGLTDVDAITLAMANHVTSGEVAADTAAGVILLSVLVNTLVKAGIVLLFGSRKLFKIVASTVVIVTVIGGGIYFLV